MKRLKNHTQKGKISGNFHLISRCKRLILDMHFTNNDAAFIFIIITMSQWVFILVNVVTLEFNTTSNPCLIWLEQKHIFSMKIGLVVCEFTWNVLVKCYWSSWVTGSFIDENRQWPTCELHSGESLQGDSSSSSGNPSTTAKKTRNTFYIFWIILQKINTTRQKKQNINKQTNHSAIAELCTLKTEWIEI